MRKEVSPTRRPLPKEAASFSSQESLASQMFRALEGETYNLREATDFLNRLAEQKGIETRISHETLRTWVVIALAEVIKPIAILPQEELTSEVFRQKFPNEEELPLSAEALLFRGESGQCKYTLSTKDLDFIISRAQEAYKEGLQSSFARAKKIIVSFQERCLRLNEIAGRLEKKAPKELDRLMLEGKLPLKNYPPLLARTIGIPREFFEQELKGEWQEYFLRKRKETLHPLRLLRDYPEEFMTLTRFLKEEEIGFQLRNISLLAAYLKEKGIEIALYKMGEGTYYILSGENQREIKGWLENEETQRQIRRIASQGFTLEEYLKTYRQHFPEESPIALSEALRLAGEPAILGNKRKRGRVKELLRQKGIPLEEKFLRQGEKKTNLVYLPLKHLAEAVSILKEASSADPTLFRSIETLYLKGEASTLTPLLTQAGIKVPTWRLPLIYEQYLANIDGIHRIREKKGYLYLVPNFKKEEAVKAIRERREEIAQTLEKAKSFRTLIKQGETLSLTALLKTAIPDLRVTKQNLRKIYRECLADIEDIKVIPRREKFSYHILKTDKEKVCEEIRAREEKIQAIVS